MSQTPDSVSAMIRKQYTEDDIFEMIFKRYFEVDGDKHKDNPGYMAWALSAVPVGIALANVLLAIKEPQSGRSFRAMCDLTYQLGANDFWTKNAPVLVPILTVCLNASKDVAGMMVEREKYREYAMHDKLICGMVVMPMEIFSMLLYLVGGPVLMATSSLPMKIDLAPYFVS